ncbi:MAG: HdeD family acid-resistance protein [Coprococcus sp.]
MGKKWKWQEISSALLMVAAGLVLLLMPELTLRTIANVVGIIVIIIGAIFLISYFGRRSLSAGNYDLVKGLVIVGAGIFICTRSELVVSILPVLLGIGVVVSGMLKLQHALDLKKMGYDTWVRIGITAAINIFIGLLVIMNPFSTVAWLMRFIGIGFIFSGVTDLITTLYVSRKASEYYVDGEAEER